MSSRPYHHGNLREALLAEAERTVRERGVQQLSLRELARDVGVSHGAPRRHFPDRQALLDALAQSGFERLGEELEAAAAGADPRFEPRLRAIAAAYVRFATRDAALLELMFAGKHGPRSGEIEQAAERAFAVMLDLIEQGQAEGALQAGEPKNVGLVLFATIQGIAALVTAGIVAPGQVAELIADAVERFLRGSRGPQPAGRGEQGVSGASPLERFVAAQEQGGAYQRAVAELRSGRKRGHWIWFVLPQIAGLGHSETSRRYAIRSLEEARAYLHHPVLGPRLVDCAEILLGLPDEDPEAVLGPVDALKLRSSMTLFARADPQQPAFQRVLDRYFGGIGDPATEGLLQG